MPRDEISDDRLAIGLGGVGLKVGSAEMLPPQFRVVTAFADALHGERGAIYKAVGFTEIGPSQGGRRVQVFHRCKFISERSARRRFGTSSAPRLAAMGLRAESTQRRTRYLALREAQGSPQARL